MEVQENGSRAFMCACFEPECICLKLQDVAPPGGGEKPNQGNNEEEKPKILTNDKNMEKADFDRNPDHEIEKIDKYVEIEKHLLSE